MSTWTVHGSRQLYDSTWVQLWLDDVELTDGHRIEHHALRFPRHSTTCVVTRDDHMLLIWRHRYITDAWGWEVPAGWSEPGEDPADAITREVTEETGWRPRDLRLLTRYNAISGIGDMHFSTYHAPGADHISQPQDGNEAARVDWLPLADVRRLLTKGDLVDGPSLTAVAYYLATA